MSSQHALDERGAVAASAPSVGAAGAPAVGAALRSQVACAVLGLVIEKPSHGYEIGQRFERRFGGFLSVGRSSIYAALSSLMEAGLIEKMSARASTGVSQGAKAGAAYRATAQGARSYRGWLAERVRNDPQRAQMLGRMTLAGVHSVEAALDFIARYEQECVREAQELARPGEDAAGGRIGISGLLERLLIEERRRMIDAQLQWITYARAELRTAGTAAGVSELR
ncbi:MAG TPA: helix-turn-helix transcriptional regulator [Solirubrobacteraceae bacterium]|nr:helix-turn-helix transcriptional regulator [Solirubrobacteraceae bacterium]